MIDGVVVPEERATISVLDRGLLYGDGLFEVLRTWNGRAVDLAAHIARMEESAELLQLDLDREAIIDAVTIAVEAASTVIPAGLDAADEELAEEAATAPAARATVAARGTRASGDWRVRIVVTRGPGSLAIPMAQAGPGQTIVIVEPLGTQPEEMSLAIVDWPLAPRTGRGHKTLAYLDHVIARELARDAGADDAIRLTSDGRVAEGGTCNVFAVRGGEVFATGAGGVLPGVTAAHVAVACERLDLPMRAGFDVPALLAADEVFVTSALRGVVAVTRIVDASGNAHMLRRGPITDRIRAAYVGDMTAL